MKSDLDLIIEFYEEEKRALEQGIKEALAERDYEEVYYRGEALNSVEGQLHRMNSLKDPLYEKKMQISRLTESAEGMGIDDRLKEYFMEAIMQTIANKERSLEELLERKAELIDTQELDDALFWLYEQKCRAFGFCFPHRDGSLCLLFELTAQKVLLISVDVKDITSDYDPEDLEEKQIHLFENLGFRYDHQKGSLVYKYDMNNFKGAWDIKIMLSRIVYDIGYFGQDKQGTIEFYD
ncbi:hypothetical protein [Mucilaginibacter pedocola]|uniref:Uncharacterized protein n=1 Tax=Mucilaginibacter pedocola TaxID=1792845 RepID=A0A1S9PMH3_9SPHI|nr:hypothetical protein [Mucilaginibacter pedocola]OOQ61788.1 hypothetical protein BC343_01585 [Mucilaginibacter pedocola]